MKITVPSTKRIYIGDTEFYRKLKTTYPMKLGCSSCKRTIDELDMMCVWVKNNFGLGWFTRGQHEDAYLLSKGSPPKPKKAISDVLDWKGTGNELHPTQKPIGALIPLIETYTEQGGVILDPFNGSGTTSVACKELGRDFIGIEINPKYCEIANRRLAQEYLFT